MKMAIAAIFIHNKIKTETRTVPVITNFPVFILNPFLFNTGSFTSTFAQIIQLSPSYFTGFMQQNSVNVGRIQREYPFYTYSIRDLSNCKRGSSTSTLDFENVALKGLDPLLITFYNFIIYSDIVTGLKLRVCFLT